MKTVFLTLLLSLSADFAHAGRYWKTGIPTLPSATANESYVVNLRSFLRDPEMSGIEFKLGPQSPQSWLKLNSVSETLEGSPGLEYAGKAIGLRVHVVEVGTEHGDLAIFRTIVLNEIVCTNVPMDRA